MTDNADDQTGKDDAATTAAEPAQEQTPESQESVAELMADAPAARDLEADALQAAEQAIAKAELALASAELAGAAADTEASHKATEVPASKQRLIQAVLVLNVVLMGLMLALPNPPAAESGSHAPAGDDPSGHGEVVGSHAADPHGGEPAGHGAVGEHGAAEGGTHDLRGGVSGAAWIRALEYSGAGDYERAAQTLETFLDANPELPAFERKTYYTALMHYLAEAGRDEEVEAYQGKLMALGNQRYLPADILRMARTAEDSGDGARMRQLYARFLLTQGRHTAAERKAVAEAYLKLGDSYRVQAERGERRASVMQRLREARLRTETRERRNAAQRGEGKE